MLLLNAFPPQLISFYKLSKTKKKIEPKKRLFYFFVCSKTFSFLCQTKWLISFAVFSALKITTAKPGIYFLTFYHCYDVTPIRITFINSITTNPIINIVIIIIIIIIKVVIIVIIINSVTVVIFTDTSSKHMTGEYATVNTASFTLSEQKKK